jgi:hypothetical protein
MDRACGSDDPLDTQALAMDREQFTMGASMLRAKGPVVAWRRKPRRADP